MTTPPTRSGLVPYLFYDDVAAMLDWYTRVFGFVEQQRWEEDGELRNRRCGSAPPSSGSTAAVGTTSRPAARRTHRGSGCGPTPTRCTRASARSASSRAPPEDKPYGVRMLAVRDPAGYQWGFMVRTD